MKQFLASYIPTAFSRKQKLRKTFPMKKNSTFSKEDKEILKWTDEFIGRYRMALVNVAKH
ncbi:MAG: hypothetical protein AAB524_02530 [Patescibacteria group bacterium]